MTIRMIPWAALAIGETSGTRVPLIFTLPTRFLEVQTGIHERVTINPSKRWMYWCLASHGR